MLVFVHIHKTAGSTFRNILTDMYPSACFQLYTEEDWEKWRGLSLHERSTYEVVYGHFNFRSVTLHTLQDPRYITFLRDPADRLLSYYCFARRLQKHPHHRVANQLSFNQFIQDFQAPEIDNGQVRFIAGRDGSISEILPWAKDNIDKRFHLVGLTERFDESILILRRMLNWSWPVYRRSNQTLVANRNNYLTENLRSIISESQWAEYELYQYAWQKLDDELNKYDDFVTDMRTFKVLNAGYYVYTKIRNGFFKVKQALS